MPRVLVSGPVGGDLQGLFAAAAKACAKAPFAALFCVGDFLGGTAPALGDLGPAPLPVYFITGSEAVDHDLADRLAAKNVRWLGRSGCEEVEGLRVAFLGGVEAGDYDSDAPEDGSDTACFVREDVETLLIASGAYRADGGCDVLLTSALPEGAVAGGGSDFEGTSPSLGRALAEVKCSYHFAAAREGGWSLDPYKCGTGGFARIARAHGLARRGLPKSLRAFDVPRWEPAHHDLDTEDGARDAARLATDLRAATPNPYALALAREVAGHKPPPGLLKRKTAAAATGEDAPDAKKDPAPVPEEAVEAAAPPTEPTPEPGDGVQFAAFPTGFRSRGAKTKTETKVVEGPQRPVYGAPNKPDEPVAVPWQPKEKKEKRQSIYANQGGGLANPSKKKKRRMGAPHGPQF